jgi:predicted ATPase
MAWFIWDEELDRMSLQQENTKENRAYLSSLRLGGFQVFGDVTEVPLGKISLLFGPNSAGKSAVQDGLELLNELMLGGNEWDRAKLHRHWRRTEQGTLAPKLTVGFTAVAYVGIPDALAAYMQIPHEPAEWLGNDGLWDGYDVSPTFEFMLEEDEQIIRELPDYTLSIDGQAVLRVTPCERIGVNFAHPVLHGFRLKHDFRALAKSMSFFELEDGWVYFCSNYVGLYGTFTDRQILMSGVEAWLTKPWDNVEGAKRLDQMIRARPSIDELLDFFDNLQSIALGNAKFMPHISVASRRTPSAADLTFHLGTDDEDRLSHLCADADSNFLRLAISAHDHLRGGGQMMAPKNGGDPLRFAAPGHLYQNINRALSDHLFAERGYALAADIRLLVDWRQMQSGEALDQYQLHEFGAIVQLHLEDHAGRRHDFGDVGSGIGYVLPVLCSVCDEQVTISLLQQPELHLHPALQAALGDVFIENASSRHQIVVETHSEHLLLRVLKRIRQSASGKPLDPTLRIAPHDVVVVYFDPRPDGTTAVKRLRISAEGEFLDRWPRGFFTERDSELFDE